MKAGRAFVAGMVGGAVMSALMWMGRTVMGMPANLEMMLGTMFTDPGATAWIIGFVMHLMISGAIALIYAWAFEHITHRAGWLLGAGFGIVHAIIGGMVMGMMPMMHPRMPNPIMPPGAFMSSMGTMGVVAEFVLHMVYGAVVGAMYGAVVHARPVASEGRPLRA
jgi:hypothetical protein